MNKKIETFLLALIAVAALTSILVTIYPTTLTGYSILECEREVPYKVTEKYTEQEPYLRTYYEKYPMEYLIEEEKSFSCFEKDGSSGICVEITLVNKDDVEGTFEISAYLEKYNDYGELFGSVEKTKSKEVGSKHKHVFSFFFETLPILDWVYGYDVEVPTKIVEKQELGEKYVEKLRTVTKHITEKGPC